MLVKTALDLRFRQYPARDPNWSTLRDELLSTLSIADAAERHNAAMLAELKAALAEAQ